MIVTQNSIVLHTNELDAVETDTYKNRSETVLCGSSMCRAKVSISKIEDCGIFTAEKRDFDLKSRNHKKTMSALPDVDIQQFNHFDRETPIKTLGNKKYSMSQRTKTKIRQKITAWAHSDRPRHQQLKFVFITLTLTSKQIGTDKDYSKMLNTFFTYLRKYYGFKNYLYVNEIQTLTTGNIHTHIIYDRFLPIGQVNRIWCKILKENGYTWTPEGSTTPIIDFPVGKNGANPVDIKEILSVKRVSSYVTKYVTKNESEFDCLIWNCSGSISRLFTSVKLWDIKTFSVLFEQSRHVIKANLGNGDCLHIHLLPFYHSIQKKHFKINDEVLSGTFDRDKFIKQNKAKCKSEPLQAETPNYQTSKFTSQLATC